MRIFAAYAARMERKMFKIKLNWDGLEYSELYYQYEFAVSALESYDRISKERKANGKLNDYYIELIKEG